MSAPQLQPQYSGLNVFKPPGPGTRHPSPTDRFIPRIRVRDLVRTLPQTALAQDVREHDDIIYVTAGRWGWGPDIDLLPKPQ